MNKQTYNVHLVEKQFQSICKVMKTVVNIQSGSMMDGPIRIVLTHGKQTMALTVSLTDDDNDN